MKYFFYILISATLIMSNLVAQENPSTLLEDVGINPKLEAQINGSIQFTDHNGKLITLDSLYKENKPIIISLVYYSCPILCNMLTDGMINGLLDLNYPIGDKFNLVSISFNAKDTTTQAAAFQTKHSHALPESLTPNNWHFLTGTEETINTFTKQVGFGFKYLEKQKEFAHPSALIILTPEGKVSRYLYGISFSKFDLKMAILEASEKKYVSTLERGLLFCYVYDPNVNSYVIQALNLMKLAGIITVLIIGIWLLYLFKKESVIRR